MECELQVFYRVLVCQPFSTTSFHLIPAILFCADLERSLEKDPPRRGTPWRMLEHPWMVEMRSKKVSMERFLQQVWDWKD